MKTLSQYKKKLDKIFSLFIRYRDNGICYTCGKDCGPKSSQCGHFVPRQYLAVRYDETNCHAQCLTEESNLVLKDGSIKSIKDIKIGDIVQSFDKNTFEKKEAIVETFVKFIPDELYEIELENGNKFYATGDHQVVANKKWMNIENMLHNSSTYDILEI